METLEKTQPVLITVQQAADRLGLKDKRLYQLVAEGVVPREVVFRYGRGIRLIEERFNAWILAGGTCLGQLASA